MKSLKPHLLDVPALVVSHLEPQATNEAAGVGGRLGCLSRGLGGGCSQQAQLVEHASLDHLRIVSSSPTLGTQPT